MVQQKKIKLEYYVYKVIKYKENLHDNLILAVKGVVDLTEVAAGVVVVGDVKATVVDPELTD